MDNVTENTENKEETPKKRRRSKAKEAFTVTLDDKSVIDLDSFDYGIKLTQKEKLFVFWYTFPENSAYHNMAAAARKAGYSQKTAKETGFRLRHSDKLSPIIAKFDKNVVKTSLDDAYHRILQRKIARADFNGLDFYNVSEVTDDNGKTYKNVTIKDPSEFTEDQKLCIDGIDFKGQRGIPYYMLPNRTAEENKLIELYEKANGEDQKEGYEVETTAEIIKGNLQVKTKVIKNNAEIAELSDLRAGAATQRVEED